jgi:hypothetical protein
MTKKLALSAEGWFFFLPPVYQKLRLFLEESIEGPAGIIGFFGVGGRLGSFGGTCFPLDAQLGFEKLALVAKVLAGNPFRDRLGAFVPQSRIEEPALLAGVQVRAALGTLAGGPDGDIHGFATQGTAGGLAKARHGPGPELPGALRCLGKRSGLFLRIIVLISPLTVFSGHNGNLLERDK